MSKDLIESYNYTEFKPENFEPLMRFGESPAIGRRGPDFPLWTIDGEETSLSALWAQHKYLVVEFGSFT